MATKTKIKPKAADKPECEVTEWLTREGFIKFDHHTQKLGDVFVLRPRSECPWWTVQKRSSGNVRWYVDFPTAVPASAICRFVESL
jgi:hypothetical protein